MFSTNWSDSAIFANSRANNSDSSGRIRSIIKLIRDLIVTKVLTKFGADWFIFVDARVLTKSDSARVNNSKCSCSICPIIELIQDLMGIYTVAKFGNDWSILADASVNKVKYGKFSNSRADNSDSSGQIRSIIELI